MFENIWRWLHFMFWSEIKWTSAMCRVSLPLKLHAGEPNYDFTQHSNGFMASGLKGGKLAQSVNNEPAQCFLFVFVPHPTGARNCSTFSGEPLERTHSGWGGGESKKPGGHDAREKRPWHVRQYLIWNLERALFSSSNQLSFVRCWMFVLNSIQDYMYNNIDFSWFAPKLTWISLLGYKLVFTCFFCVLLLKRKPPLSVYFSKDSLMLNIWDFEH